jgi:hypothetical protein
MSRAVTFGPEKYRGIDLRDFKIEQGIESIQLVMRHLRFPSQPQKMFLITLDMLRHNLGLGTPLLEYPHIWVPHLEGLWILKIRKFLQRMERSLTIADITIQPLQRQHDCHIMDAVVTGSSFPPPLKYAESITADCTFRCLPSQTCATLQAITGPWHPPWKTSIKSKQI